MRLVKVKDFTAVATGGTPSTKKEEFWAGGDIPWLNSGELNQDIVNTSENFITPQGLKHSSARMMPPDTVLIALTGATTGKVGYLTFEACANQSVTGILPSSNHLPKYLYYYLNSIRNKVLDDAYGGAQPHISQGYVKEIKIPLPPLDEQKKIATILDAADALRQKDKALIAKYDELTQSLFVAMFGDPVTNPMGWELRQVKELCHSIVDCVNKTAPVVDQATEYKMIRTTNVRDYAVNLNSVRYVTQEVFDRWNRRLTPQIGDVVFTREAPVGEAGIIWFPDKVFLGQRTMIYRVNPQRVNNVYLLHQLMDAGVKRQIASLSMGSTVKHLAVPTCEVFNIVTPPIALQDEFSERVKAIEEQKSIAHTSLNKSEALFNSLLQKAFKGELTN